MGPRPELLVQDLCCATSTEASALGSASDGPALVQSSSNRTTDEASPDNLEALDTCSSVHAAVGATCGTAGGTAPAKTQIVLSKVQASLEKFVTSASLDLKAMVDRRNLKTFFVDVFLCDIIGKQIPVAFGLALPVMIIDFIARFVFRPQNDLIFEDEAHRLMNNATFNVHLKFNPGPQEPGVLGTYLPGQIAGTISEIGLFTWMVVYVPYSVLSKDDFLKSTPKRFWVAVVLMNVGVVFLNFFAGMNADMVDGPHNYTVIPGRTISPGIPIILGFCGLSWWRGRLMKATTNTNLWCLGLGFLQSAMWLTLLVEIVFVLGMRAPIEVREIYICFYRGVIWPLLWYVVLTPIFRYTLLMIDGELENYIPYLGVMLAVMSQSSRFFMYAVDNEVYFMGLVLEDAILQALSNWYYGDHKQPLLDHFMIKVWKRCVSLGDIDQLDHRRARLVRMSWFQAQSVVDLMVIFATTFRLWVFHQSRHVFALMYRPDCNNLDVFDWQGALTKCVFSIAMLALSDAKSSYMSYCKGYPLTETFRKLVGSARSCMSFSVTNFLVFCLLFFNMQPIIGRRGQCEDFNNGCSCAGLAMYKEICGCCGLTPAQAAASGVAACGI